MIDIKTLKKVAELTLEDYSYRDISAICGVGSSTITRTKKLLRAASLNQDSLRSMSDKDWSGLYYSSGKRRDCSKALPDFERIYGRLKRNDIHTSIKNEYEQYHDLFPDGYHYTQFKKHLHEWMKENHPGEKAAMHVDRKPGKFAYIDWVGDQPAIVRDPKDPSRKVKAHFFVVALGYSSLTYIEAFPDEKQPSVMAGLEHAIRYFGALPYALRPDNMKTAVITNTKEELVLNQALADFQNFYDLRVLPARPLKPKDKGAVERAVRIVEMEFIANHADQIYENFEELNKAAAEFVEKLNNRPKSGEGKSRRELFETIDLPAMRPLPNGEFTFYDYKTLKVPRNYHVKYDGHYYSVPYTLLGEYVTVKADEKQIIICDRCNLTVALHKRSYNPNDLYISEKEHMKSSHRMAKEIEENGVEYYLNWADRIGPSMKELITVIMNRAEYPEHSFNSCQAILTACNKLSNSLANAAAKDCCESYTCTIKGFRAAVIKRQKGLKAKGKDEDKSLPDHQNIRGKGYYR